MIISIVLYVVLAGWLLLGGPKGRCTSMVLSVCYSSAMAYLNWQIDDVAMLLYLIVGVVFVIFGWALLDDFFAQEPKKQKNKFVAAFLSLILGSFGVHRFYLRKIPSGLLYVLCCWSLIPFVLGIVEAIRFLFMKKQKFDQLYNTSKSRKEAKERTEDNRPCAVEHDNIVNVPVCNAINERNGDVLNYNDIRLFGYQAKAVGSVEDFSIVVNANGNSYTFKVKNGDISAYRSDAMRAFKSYEVT